MPLNVASESEHYFISFLTGKQMEIDAAEALHNVMRNIELTQI